MSPANLYLIQKQVKFNLEQLTILDFITRQSFVMKGKHRRGCMHGVSGKKFCAASANNHAIATAIKLLAY